MSRKRWTHDTRRMRQGGTERGDGTVYDWWSRHPRALDLLYELAFLGRESTFRQLAIETLDPGTGETVLEMGCGNGNSFPALRAGVASSGSVLGFDVSGGMTGAARKRIREAGWENVHVVRGDARRLPVADRAADAAYASMSLSAVSDPHGAVESIRDALRPGGRFVVLDAQPFRGWPWRLLNPCLVPIARRTTEWVPEVDLPDTLRQVFAEVSISTFNGGSIFVAVARKRPG